MPKTLKILKIDAFYPTEYLEDKKKECWQEINQYNYNEYYDWLMKLRSYLSDYFTYQMNSMGYEAREFITHDSLLLKKLIKDGHISGIGIINKIRFFLKLLLRFSPIDYFSIRKKISAALKLWYLEKYIDTYNPDILIIREPSQIDGNFFNNYKPKIFVVSIIGCNTNHPINWKPHRNNLIVTLTKVYQDFLKCKVFLQ